MPETTASRVLRLLPLLTSRPEWRDEELAEALAARFVSEGISVGPYR